MSAIVTPADVQKIAALARMTLSDEEVTTATRDLSRVLDHFSTIQSIETANVPESSDLTDRTNVAREDMIGPEQLCSAGDLLDRAPATHEQYVKVPAIF